MHCIEEQEIGFGEEEADDIVDQADLDQSPGIAQEMEVDWAQAIYRRPNLWRLVASSYVNQQFERGAC